MFRCVKRNGGKGLGRGGGWGGVYYFRRKSGGVGVVGGVGNYTVGAGGIV